MRALPSVCFLVAWLTAGTSAAQSANGNVRLVVGFSNTERLETRVNQDELGELTGQKLPYVVGTWLRAGLRKLDLPYTETSGAGGKEIASIRGVGGASSGRWIYLVDGVSPAAAMDSQVVEGIRVIELMFEPAGSRLAPQCLLGAELAESETLIAYAAEGPLEIASSTRRRTIGALRPAALLRGGSLAGTDGSSLRPGARVWRVLAPSDPPLALSQVSSLLDVHGDDHCVYSADFARDTPVAWTLLSTRPLHELRAASPAEHSDFARRNPACVDQGDPDPAKKPPCTRPKLLAVSDVDRDGLLEFWATQPYLWDTGLSVAEQKDAGLSPVLEACPGCSD